MATTERSAVSPRPRRRYPPERPSHLIYLYCVIEQEAPATSLLATGEVEGMEAGQPLFPIEASGLVAAASRVSSSVFGEEPLNALVEDIPRLTPFVYQHERAVRALLSGAPALVPLNFGSVYESESHIANLLSERSAEFKALLDRVRNREEWGLKVLRDKKRVEAVVEAESEAIRQAAEEVRAASPGRAYLATKRQQRLVQSESRALVAAATHGIVAALEVVSDATLVDELPSLPETDTGLVLKAAFLVRSPQVELFQEAIDELRMAHEPRGLTLEASGPWAPYSFVGGRRNAA